MWVLVIFCLISYFYSCKVWVDIASNIKITEMFQSNFKKLYNQFICSNHFATSDQLSSTHRTVLTKHAVPISRQSSSLELPLTTTIEIVNCSSPPSLITSPENNSFMSKVTHLFRRKYARKSKTSQLSSKITSVVRKRIRFYQLKLAKIRYQRKNTKKIIENRKSLLPFLQKIDTVRNLFNPSAFEFIKCQFQYLFTSKHGHRWSFEMKRLSTAIYHRSPSTYSLLQSLFKLPSPKTISRSINSHLMDTDLTENHLNILRSFVTNLSFRDRICSLSFDEIALKSHFHYNRKKDFVDGFVDFGTISKSSETATHALVFAIRGITSNWKYPLCFYFSRTAAPSTILKKLITKILDSLDLIQLKVHAIVCDQSNQNQNLAKNHLNITVEKPFFIHNNRKIFFIFDVPHLMKTTRNALMKHNIKFADNQMASWSHIQTLFDMSKDSPSTLSPKLTEKHINPRIFDKQSVKLATQVLSHSCASAIYFSVATVKMTSSSLGTALFCQNMDKLFDSLNSTSYNSTKYHQTPLNSNSTSMVELKNSIDFIKSWTFHNPSTDIISRKVIPTKNSWLITINSFIGLVETLSPEVEYIFTRRINQDVLENFFGIIRRRSSTGGIITPNIFRSSFKNIIVSKVCEQSLHTNCEPDNDLLLNDFVQSDISISDQPSSSVPSTNSNILELAVYSINNKDLLSVHEIPENNISSYVAGFIIRRIKRLIKCNNCFSTLSSSDTCRPDLLFTDFKNYSNSSIHLMIPSIEFSNITNSSINIVHQHFKVLSSECLIRNKLFGLILENVDFSWIPQCHQTSIKNTFISYIIIIFIYHYVKHMNQKLITDRSQSYLRKAKKFSHI